MDNAVDGFVFSEAVEGETEEETEVGNGVAGAGELGEVLDLPVAAGLNRSGSRR